MRRFLTIFLGLALLTGTVSTSFAQNGRSGKHRGGKGGGHKGRSGTRSGPSK